MSDPGQTMRVAAVQMEGRVADIAFNLRQVRRLIVDAASQGAKVIALPEFFTTCIVYDERLFGCSLPPENPALDMLRSLAGRYRCHIGGSYLEMRAGDVYNTYVFVEPNGTVHRHDKDLPTMVENAFYVGGNDDGLMETSIGAIGAALCWEMLRSQTPRRLAGRVDLLMTGSHWWSGPGWKALARRMKTFDAGNLRMMFKTPGKLAALVGAPLLHAGHTGMLEGRFLTVPGTRLNVGTRTQLTGETQIIDGQGRLCARREFGEGAGVVVAEIELGRREPRGQIPDRFWLPPRLGLGRLLWHHQNTCGKSVYRWAKRTGRLQVSELGEDRLFETETEPETKTETKKGST